MQLILDARRFGCSFLGTQDFLGAPHFGCKANNLLVLIPFRQEAQLFSVSHLVSRPLIFYVLIIPYNYAVRK